MSIRAHILPFAGNDDPVLQVRCELDRHTAQRTCRIPRLWDCWGYDGRRARTGRDVAVDLGDYLRACIDWIGRSATCAALPGRSLSASGAAALTPSGRIREAGRTRKPGDWVRAGTMYGMMVRTASAWDHDGDGDLGTGDCRETGTFLKSILLLPHLKRMGITILYLLPIAKVSRSFRRGELGCPYAAKNFLELEPDLHDPLAPGCDVNTQCAAFIACAHRLGMRVILDVAPRVMGRDSDWILEHPEWFYWIDASLADRYRAPVLPGITYGNPIPSRLCEVYARDAVREHLRMFRHNPAATDPRRWSAFARQAKARPPEDLVGKIAREFGVMTPPGFSDVINDPQPPWSDVTYLRLFEDHPVACGRQLPDPDAQPPYVLFDTVKSSVFEGTRPQNELWERLAGIIPFYQRLGIDGARVDMSHALPHALVDAIFSRPRERDPDFCFLAEDLGTENHAKLRRSGYNIMVGPAWYMEPRAHEGLLHRMVADLPKLKVPVLAGAETPDTPRAVTRRGGKQFSRLTAVLNNFLPNAVPLVHSGMEVLERQPVNLGLDNTEAGRHMLSPRDPQAGRLAFFDRYALHWNSPGADAMVDLLARAGAVRARFLDALVSPRSWFVPRVMTNASRVAATAFDLGSGRGCLLVLANVDFVNARITRVAGFPATVRVAQVLLELHASAAPRISRGTVSVRLAPGDVKVIRLAPNRPAGVSGKTPKSSPRGAFEGTRKQGLPRRPHVLHRTRSMP